MITFHILGDGPRDEAMVPLIAERLLKVRIRAEYTAWKDLRARGGYEGKLKFAARRAVDANVPRLIATVDTDKDVFGKKLKRLSNARRQDSTCNSLLRIALGEAFPHAEAWLLDDPVAVRNALHLPSDADIPSTKNEDDPKQALEYLRRIGDRVDDPILAILADIAGELDPSRCGRAEQTGFQAFQEELVAAFRTIAAECGTDCQCGDECR